MKIRSSIKKAGNRILKKENKQYGIINYDEDNCYPQRIMLISNSSPTAKACLDVYGRFIEGGGFKDLTFYKAIVNTNGQTMDKILGLISADFARFRGFAIHCNVTLDGEITEIYHTPFENVRLASVIKRGETGYDYAVYTDWNKQVKSVNVEEIIWLNKFDLDKEEIVKQFDYATDNDGEYKGQLLYYSSDEGSYPLATVDVILEAMFSEIQSDITTTTNIEENFTAKGVFIHKGKFLEDEHGYSQEREDFNDEFEEFIGPEGASVIVADVDNDEEVPEFVKLDTLADDKVFQYTDDKVLNKIIRSFKLPKILLSVTDSGGFFNQEQIRDAVAFYNLMTLKERLAIEAIFTKIGQSLQGVTNASNDYSVAPIDFKVSKTEPPLSLVKLIQDKTISVETKRFTLITFYSLNEEEAKMIVPDADPNDRRLPVDSLGVQGTQALTNMLAQAGLTAEQKKATLIIVFGFTDADAAAMAGIVTTPAP